MRPFLIIALIFSFLTSDDIFSSQILDPRDILKKQTFWDNNDFEWFNKNIPILDTPNKEINTTYYYRWELVSKHLTYGSINTGYLWTEFINRPFWSGTYGAIACPSGHQFYEARWLKNPRYVRDYARYWFRTPGAQPLRYSAWMADSVWSIHQIHPNKSFLIDILPDLKKNLESWTKRSWVNDKGMFWQVGHDDGMEFNIASRQTKNILSGAPCYRPSFNSYMWADLNALSKISKLSGNKNESKLYEKKALALKKELQNQLWDKRRDFFLVMFRDDEVDDQGNKIKKNTRIYDSGKFAGNPHGRELAGYVPWAFNLPDAGFEKAWKFLMDPNYFFADYGPTTVERNDPLFLLKNSCCWWSGQSWPFATTQTLKAMANLLHNYDQKHVSKDDYYKLIDIYAKSHRKDGKPYIAEALHPDSGKWDHHDFYYRSEHYFHSGFVDLIITGLCGLIVSDDDTLKIDPLIPSSWNYFALDNVPYRGHRISIIWDKNGSRYGKGRGLNVFVNGEKIASSSLIQKINVKLPEIKNVPIDPRNEANYAINNDGSWYPRHRTSFTGPKSSLAFIHDGNTAWYHKDPPLRWTSEGSNNEKDWIEVNFGECRPINKVKVYLLDDGEKQSVTTPKELSLQYTEKNNDNWIPIKTNYPPPESIEGRKPTTLNFKLINAMKIRLSLTNKKGQSVGLTEFETWGPLNGQYIPASPPSGNIAINTSPAKNKFPKASSSFHDRYGGVPSSVNDGKIIYRATPTNRWTSYGSPNTTSDWLEIDFGKEKEFCRAVLHIYDDRGGVQAPKKYTLYYWNQGNWKEIPNQKKTPSKPTGSAANIVKFNKIKSNKIRIIFEHIGGGNTRSGLTELEVWEE